MKRYRIDSLFPTGWKSTTRLFSHDEAIRVALVTAPKLKQKMRVMKMVGPGVATTIMVIDPTQEPQTHE